MKFLLHRLTFVVIVSLLAAVPPVAAQSPAGTVAGSVSNAATRTFLAGAQVSLSGTSFDTLTNRDGTFEITGVPAGNYTLEVSYTGLDRYTQPIEVRAGRNAV